MATKRIDPSFLLGLTGNPNAFEAYVRTHHTFFGVTELRELVKADIPVDALDVMARHLRASAVPNLVQKFSSRSHIEYWMRREPRREAVRTKLAQCENLTQEEGQVLFRSAALGTLRQLLKRGTWGLSDDDLFEALERVWVKNRAIPLVRFDGATRAGLAVRLLNLYAGSDLKDLEGEEFGITALWLYLALTGERHEVNTSTLRHASASQAIFHLLYLDGTAKIVEDDSLEPLPFEAAIQLFHLEAKHRPYSSSCSYGSEVLDRMDLGQIASTHPQRLREARLAQHAGFESFLAGTSDEVRSRLFRSTGDGRALDHIDDVAEVGADDLYVMYADRPDLIEALTVDQLLKLPPRTLLDSRASQFGMAPIEWRTATQIWLGQKLGPVLEAKLSTEAEWAMLFDQAPTWHGSMGALLDVVEAAAA